MSSASQDDKAYLTIVQFYPMPPVPWGHLSWCLLFFYPNLNFLFFMPGTSIVHPCPEICLSLVLPGESQGWASTESGTTEVTSK